MLHSRRAHLATRAWHELTPWQDTLASTSWFISGSSVHVWLLPPSSCSQKGWIDELSTSGWWFGACFMFPYIGNVIIPTVTHTP